MYLGKIDRNTMDGDFVYKGFDISWTYEYSTDPQESAFFYIMVQDGIRIKHEATYTDEGPVDLDDNSYIVDFLREHHCDI